jgi:hypothetical protein
VNPARKKRIAIVIANPATSITTGWPVGFWWSKLTHSYYLLTESGMNGLDLQAALARGLATHCRPCSSIGAH